MARFVNPVPDYPYAESGFLFFFESNTTTPKDTYADVNEEILNENPVPLNGDGTVPNIFYSGTARVVLEDADGVQQWERDPVEAVSGGGSVNEWSPLDIYEENDVVIGSDDNYYRSIIEGNQNNDPTSTSGAWVLVQFIELWDVAVTYALGFVVKDSAGNLYKSLSSDNLGNDPTTDDVNWAPAVDVITQGLDSYGLILSDTTVDGYNISSVTSNGVGDWTVTFANAASATEKQTITGNADGTSPIAVNITHTNTTAVRVRMWQSDSATPINNFPTDLHRKLIT